MITGPSNRCKENYDQSKIKLNSVHSDYTTFLSKDDLMGYRVQYSLKELHILKFNVS